MLPEGVVVTAPDAVEKYRFDWTHDAAAGTPLAAVRAESAEQVQATMRWASRTASPSCRAAPGRACRAGRSPSTVASSCRSSG